MNIWVGGRQSDNGVVSVCVKKMGKVIDERWLVVNQYFPAIFLVGPMGAGKTTMGKLLAKHLNRSFIDSDQYIAGRVGADIPWIFEKEGEQGFRERECQALSELTVLPKIVLATGGGAVERAFNRELLKQGFVIYLNASVEVQLSRTKASTHRPLLMQGNPRQVLEERYQKRHPLYLEVADLVVATGFAFPKQMLGEILEKLYRIAQTNALNYQTDNTICYAK